MRVLRALWEGWKRIAHRIGVVQTGLIMTLFYFTVIGPAAVIGIIARRDLLRARGREESYYRPHAPHENTEQRYRHQF